MPGGVGGATSRGVPLSRSASTGSSRLNRLPRASVFRELLCYVVFLDHTPLRMIVTDPARLDANGPAIGRCDTGWLRHGRFGLHRRSHFGPAHHAIAVANFDP